MSECHNKPILILMGPTASGKSAMGISIAKAVGGVIINADAMQCYADLQIISARPTQDEMQGTPHQLYGIWGSHTLGNTALWQQAAVQAIHAAHVAGQVPILLGGTGMYIKCLTDGLSSIPAISEDVRAQVVSLSAEQAYAELTSKDAAMAAKLEPNDQQRVGRALEVMIDTGRSLADWQREETLAPFDKAQCHTAVVDIARETLYERINMRFEQMIEQGALEEVAALREKFTVQELADTRLPILKTLGVPELMDYLSGETDLPRAMGLGQQRTRNYAKRQMTWIRGQVKEAQKLPFEGYEAELEEWLGAITF